MKRGWDSNDPWHIVTHYSSDGKFWWNGYRWEPIGTMSNYTYSTTTTNTSVGIVPTNTPTKSNIKKQINIKDPEGLGELVIGINKSLQLLLPKNVLFTVQKVNGRDQILIDFDLTALKSDDEKERVILFDDEEE